MSERTGRGPGVVVVGAGSSYTPELFASLVKDPQAPAVRGITLVDLNGERLDFIARVCHRILQAAGSDMTLSTTTDLSRALPGADFVVLQLRVGGLDARTRDERLPMEFGLIGNETTGAGGFVCALRTVPAVLEIARLVERLAPDAWVLNLSNPAGIVTEALLKYTSLRSIGFCNIPVNTADALARVLAVERSQIRLDSFGLNHLSWVRGAMVAGEERLKPLIQAGQVGEQSELGGLLPAPMDLELLRLLQLIPSWYVRYYYFTDQVLEEERAADTTKGERDREAEDRLQAIYDTTGFTAEASAILAAKGGADYYANVLQVIGSITDDRGDEVVVDTRNGSAMPDLPSDVCVEVPARIGRDGPRPLSVGPMPLAVRGLVQSVKAYEELTVEAARTGDRGLAIEALAAHPLVGSFSLARRFFDRVLEAEGRYLTSFLDSGAA